MKKIISLLLAIVLMMSLAIPAFATTVENSSEVILTTVVPEVSYTLNIPAEVNIPYGEVEYEIANPTITNVQRFNQGDRVVLSTPYSHLAFVDENNGIHFLGMVLLVERTTPDGEIIDESTYVAYDGIDEIIAYEHGVESVLKYYSIIYQGDWETALPGRYTGTVTFNAKYVPAA